VFSRTRLRSAELSCSWAVYRFLILGRFLQPGRSHLPGALGVVLEIHPFLELWCARRCGRFLTESGPELIEVAPGLDLEKHVLSQMVRLDKVRGDTTVVAAAGHPSISADGRFGRASTCSSGT